MLRIARILGLWLWAASIARADSPLPLTFTLEGPPECGTAEHVEAQLGRIVSAGDRALPDLVARATIAKRGGRYEATLRTAQDGQEGERSLVAEDCPTLLRSVTLVLAVAFGAGDLTLAPPEEPPVAAVANTEPAPTPEPPAPPPAPPPEVPANPAPPTRPSLRAALLAGGGVSFGPLPRPSFWLSAGGELALGHFVAAARVVARRALEDDVRGLATTRFDGLGGALTGCARYVLRGPTLDLCGGVVAEALRGRARGDRVDDGSAVSPWYAARAALGLGIPLHRRFAVRAEAALDLSLVRPRFTIDGLGTVHRVPLLAPGAGALFVFTPGG